MIFSNKYLDQQLTPETRPEARNNAISTYSTIYYPLLDKAHPLDDKTMANNSNYLNHNTNNNNYFDGLNNINGASGPHTNMENLIDPSIQQDLSSFNPSLLDSSGLTPAHLTELDEFDNSDLHHHNDINSDLSNSSSALVASPVPTFLKITNPNLKKNTTIKKQTTTKPPKSKPAFVMKLWTMVNDSSNHELINWANSGKTFLVTNRELFVQKVLPKYFKHSNFASFVRQLNMYGWHKVQDANSGSLHSDEKWQFSNPNFQQNKPELLEKIVRNKPNDEEFNQIDVSLFINELNALKSNQIKISQELQRVKQDNQLVWQELYSTREKNLLQNSKIEKILQFLSKLYGNNVKMLEQFDHNSNITELSPESSAAAAANNNANSNVNSHNINSNISSNMNNGNNSSSFSDINNLNDAIVTSPELNDLMNGNSLDLNSYQKPRLLLKQRSLSNSSSYNNSPQGLNSNNNSSGNSNNDSPIQEIIRTPSAGNKTLPGETLFPDDELNEFLNGGNATGNGAAGSGRPRLDRQASLEGLNKSIEQQGQSLDDLLNRLQTSQQPTDDFAIDDFLQDELLGTGEKDTSKRTIEEINDEGNSNNIYNNNNNNNNNEEDDDEGEVEEIINPSKKRKSDNNF